MEIRDITLNDLNDVARVHYAAFRDSALTQLGEEAVRRYYAWQLDDVHDHMFVGLYRDDVLLGFCVGGISRGALSGFLQRNQGFLMRTVALHPWLLFTNSIFRDRASLALKVLFKRPRFLKKPSGPSIPQTEPAQPRSFGILSIAADPAFQGQGVGKEIIVYVEQHAHLRGFMRMHLTVHPTNIQAIGFYEHLGWEKVPQDGEWAGRMTKVLD